MQSTVRTFETQDNTYYISYGRTAKTSYEQQQEHKAERIKTIQKVLFILAVVSVTVLSYFIIPEAIFYMTLICLLGIAAIVTNKFALFNQEV